MSCIAIPQICFCALGNGLALRRSTLDFSSPVDEHARRRATLAFCRRASRSGTTPGGIEAGTEQHRWCWELRLHRRRKEILWAPQNHCQRRREACPSSDASSQLAASRGQTRRRRSPFPDARVSCHCAVHQHHFGPGAPPTGAGVAQTHGFQTRAASRGRAGTPAPGSRAHGRPRWMTGIPRPARAQHGGNTAGLAGVGLAPEALFTSGLRCRRSPSSHHPTGGCRRRSLRRTGACRPRNGERAGRRRCSRHNVRR
jgi:hypothetical protein